MFKRRKPVSIPATDLELARHVPSDRPCTHSHYKDPQTSSAGDTDSAEVDDSKAAQLLATTFFADSGIFFEYSNYMKPIRMDCPKTVC